MQVARTTVQRIYEIARKKIADALIDGHPLKICLLYTSDVYKRQLFSDLTEKEKKIVSDYFIMGKQVKETAEELGISTRQVSRDKNSALAKRCV